MSDAPHAPVAGPVSSPPAGVPADAAQLEHLANLHRMSRTAGLGSSEYAAVNVAAVAAIVLGAASALAMITQVFLFVPVVGLVIAIVAIKQIRGSGGTQTGLLLAIVGLLACCGFAGLTGFQAFSHARQAQQDTAAMDGLVVQFGQLLADKKYKEALDLGDPRWQEQMSLERLEHFMDELSASPFGQFKGFKPTSLYDIQEDPETHMRMGVGYLNVDAVHTDTRPLRTQIQFRNNGDAWKIYSMPEWFKPPAAPGAKGGAESPSGPAGPPAP